MANRKVILALRESSHRSLTPCTHFSGAKVQFLGQLSTQYAGNHSLLLLLVLFRLPWPQGPQLSGAYMVHWLTWEPVCKQHFLEYYHARSFLYYLWLLLCYNGRVEYLGHRPYGSSAKPKIFTNWPLKKKFANLLFRLL